MLQALFCQSGASASKGISSAHPFRACGAIRPQPAFYLEMLTRALRHAERFPHLKNAEQFALHFLLRRRARRRGSPSRCFRAAFHARQKCGFPLKSTCRPQGDGGLSAIGMARSGFQRRLPAKRGPFESASRKGAALPFGERRPISKTRPPLSLVLSMAKGALLPFPVAPHGSESAGGENSRLSSRRIERVFSGRGKGDF